jgi:hypothetical protein
VLPAAQVPVVMNPFIRPCPWDSDSSSSGEDERRKRRRKIVTYAAMSALAEVNTSLDARTRGGSRPGKSPNRDRALCQGAIELDKDYFNRLGLVSAPRLELDFERRYRMPRALLYERVRAGVLEVDSYFEQRPDAAGVMGASADQKITAAMRQLAYGYPADAAAELVRVSESLASESLIRFCRAVRKKFEPDYLRRPNKDELREIEQHYASLGFPGCIGCVDVASWTWDKCPVAWQGQYTGKEKKPCNRLEIVCDDFLRIWHVNFGSPGSRNDISIYHQSRLFNDIRVGKWPDVEPEIIIGEFSLTWFYMLSDGIYPKVKHLINSMHGDTARENLFARQQEAVRKAVERVFAVLFSRFNIIYQPSRLFDKGYMEDVIFACCILHNMICEVRKESYTGTRNARVTDLKDFIGQVSGVTLISEPDDLREASLFWMLRLNEDESPLLHKKLKDALAAEMWYSKGEEADLS